MKTFNSLFLWQRQRSRLRHCFFFSKKIAVRLRSVIHRFCLSVSCNNTRSFTLTAWVTVFINIRVLVSGERLNRIRRRSARLIPHNPTLTVAVHRAAVPRHDGRRLHRALRLHRGLQHFLSYRTRLLLRLLLSHCALHCLHGLFLFGFLINGGQ